MRQNRQQIRMQQQIQMQQNQRQIQMQQQIQTQIKTRQIQMQLNQQQINNNVRKIRHRSEVVSVSFLLEKNKGKESEMEKMENVTYMQAGPVLIIGLPEEVDDHVCNGIREETDRYISAGKVQKLIFDFSKTGFMDSSGIGILLGRYKRMHHMGGEVLVTGEDAKIRRLLRISGVYQVVGTL